MKRFRDALLDRDALLKTATLRIIELEDLNNFREQHIISLQNDLSATRKAYALLLKQTVQTEMNERLSNGG